MSNIIIQRVFFYFPLSLTHTLITIFLYFYYMLYNVKLIKSCLHIPQWIEIMQLWNRDNHTLTTESLVVNHLLFSKEFLFFNIIDSGYRINSPVSYNITHTMNEWMFRIKRPGFGCLRLLVFEVYIQWKNNVGRKFPQKFFFFSL